MTQAPRRPHRPAPRPAGPRVSRWRVALPAILLGVAFLGLGAFWAVASWWTGHEVDHWLQREAALGRVWSCPDRKIAGFPFRIEISCEAPSFAGRVGDGQASGSLARVLAVAQIYNPRHVIVEAEGPLLLRADNGAQAQLDWTLGRASVIGEPGKVERLAMELTAPKLKITGVPGGEFAASAEMADLHLRRTPDRPAADRAYDVASRLSKAVIPPLDALARDASPADADVVATLTQAEPLAGIGFAAAAEQWRKAGGRLQISTLTLAKGGKQLSAAGTLGLDEAHRPQGRVELRLVGFDDMLKTFGLDTRTAVLGGLLAGILGGKADAPPANGPSEAGKQGGPNAGPSAGKDPGKPAGITLPLKLENGRAFLGPAAVAVLLPLY